MKTNIKYHFLTLIALATLVSCQGLLEYKPLAVQEASEQLKSERSMELYANGMIASYIPSGSGVWGANGDLFSDLCATVSSTEYFKTSYNPTTASGWSSSNWAMIRRANYLIENIERGKGNVSDEVYNHYLGVGYFWRAYGHFQKIKTFGDVPFIDHVIQETDDPALFAGRQDREEVMHYILQDINEAVKDLSDDNSFMDESRINVTKFVALAIKSRMCLYEGTYRKYHSTNYSTGEPWNNKYETADQLLQECIDACEELLAYNKFPLNTVSGAEGPYRQLFTQESVNKEFIWAYTYSSSIPKYDNRSFNYFSTTAWQMPSPTRTLVRHYLKADGNPLLDDALDVNAVFAERDPRLSQTIASPGLTYTDNNLPFPRTIDFSVSRTGYMWHKWIIEDYEHYHASRDVAALPVLRTAEVLLNLAEAKCELDGTLTEADWNRTIGALRERVGEPSIYPGGASYVTDPWLMDYYSTADNVRPSKILAEIRRERTVELVFENGLRQDDLFRWRLGEHVCDQWQGIYLTAAQVSSGKFNFNGTDFAIGKSVAQSQTAVHLDDSGANATFRLSDGNASAGYLEYIVPRTWSEKLYLNPIPQTAINVNGNLAQNALWE
ncbi:MAG: RagB/SusD family nutrient uptake outer membrane protein [Bacteroidales bacterium]|nr:RagB/SusD family nutrient uptake outer membrane protein [Bacteroidales bacterium]